MLTNRLDYITKDKPKGLQNKEKVYQKVNKKVNLLIYNVKNFNIIQYIIDKKGINVTQIAKDVGVSKSHISNILNGKPIGLQFASKIAAAYNMPLTEVLGNEVEIVQPQGEIITNGKKNIKRKEGLIPFYNADFIAGNAELFYEDATIYPEYYIDVPDFSGCIAFRAFSDSMENIIRSGNILFGTKIDDWQSHLEYGQIYGITCTDGRRYLKYIRRCDANPLTHFLLKSENKHYDDFEIPKDKIKNIWLIEGWLNKTN